MHRRWAIHNRQSCIVASLYSNISTNATHRQIILSSRAADLWEVAACRNVRACKRCKMVRDTQCAARSCGNPARTKSVVLHYAFFHPISIVLTPTPIGRNSRNKCVDKIVLWALLFQMQGSGVENPEKDICVLHFCLLLLLSRCLPDLTQHSTVLEICRSVRSLLCSNSSTTPPWR